MTMRQVLLIEDEAVAAQTLCQSMQAFNIECRWVTDVDEARRALKKKVYDAVITDIVLGPGKPDGIDMVREVERTGMVAPVVVITSFADLDRVKDALNHGASYLLEKPFHAMELKRVLDRIWEEPRGLVGLRERALAHENLTEKERQVARLLLKGLSTQEMAHVTGNSEKTLKQHISRIYEKCGVSSRAEFFHYIFPT